MTHPPPAPPLPAPDSVLASLLSRDANTKSGTGLGTEGRVTSPIVERRVISLADVLSSIDDALTAMVDIVTDLGDDLANRRPQLPGANSPYAILTHCLGVLEQWGGESIAGRPFTRDRDAEFRATGAVADLTRRADAARRQLDADLAAFVGTDPPRGTVEPDDRDRPLGRSQGGVALHIFEELSQHLGQMELTRDVLQTAAADDTSDTAGDTAGDSAGGPAAR
jgi:hypothetical protein